MKKSILLAITGIILLSACAKSIPSDYQIDNISHAEISWYHFKSDIGNETDGEKDFQLSDVQEQEIYSYLSELSFIKTNEKPVFDNIGESHDYMCLTLWNQDSSSGLIYYIYNEQVYYEYGQTTYVADNNGIADVLRDYVSAL